MGEASIESLARQLVRRMGRSQAIQICQANGWFRVLDQIRAIETKFKGQASQA